MTDPRLTVVSAITLYSLSELRGTLLLAGAIILGAAVRELLTAFFLFQEMMVQDIMARLPVRYLQLGLMLASIVVPPIAAWKVIQVSNPHENGDSSEDIAPPRLPAGNVAALLAYAGEIGVPKNAVASLHTAISADEASSERGQYGPQVRSWLDTNLGYASTEVASQSVELLAKAIVKSFYLDRAIAQYYGHERDE